MKAGALTSERPTYHSPLRQAQAAATRRAILDAAAELVENGDDPTFTAIAARAGVQERTVYRHFRTKDELHTAFWDHIHEQRIEAGFTARDLDSLTDLVRDSFNGFDRNPALVRTMLHSPQGLAMRLSRNDERQRMFTHVVDRELDRLPADVRHRAAAAAQVLYSATSWEYLSEYWGMDVHEAIATVQQALRAMFAGLARSSPPSKHPSKPASPRPTRSTSRGG